MNTNYDVVFKYMRNKGFPEVSGAEFYKELFPDNECTGEFNTDFSKPNAIYLYYDKDAGKLKRRIMLKDTWEDDYKQFIENNELTLCSGLSYRRRANKLENAQKMHALIFDIDGVGEFNINAIMKRSELPPEHLRSIPTPTYIVLSGSGVHLYYFFTEPIDLYPNIKIQLKSLKYDLTFRFWDYGGTSQVEQIQYQSINQSFRMVGSINKKYNKVVRAFRTGQSISIDLLNRYADDERNRVDLNKPFKPTQTVLADAKEKYPEWYQRVVVEGNKKPKKWAISEKVNGNDPFALYHWWIKQVKNIKGGHRYFFMMCTAIYACKCDVPKKKLREDLQEVYEYLQTVKHDNSLTYEDYKSALECYGKEYYDTSIKEIEYWTDLRIERNRRNGRTQKEHLRRARAVQVIDYPNGEWRTNNGRKSKAAIIHQWQQENPAGRKIDCIRETGISKPTVYKHWK